MEKSEELKAAEEHVRRYADFLARYSSMAGDAVRDAFLAGIEWQKNRYHAPDKEYYGG